MQKASMFVACGSCIARPMWYILKLDVISPTLYTQASGMDSNARANLCRFMQLLRHDGARQN